MFAASGLGSNDRTLTIRKLWDHENKHLKAGNKARSSRMTATRKESRDTGEEDNKRKKQKEEEEEATRPPLIQEVDKEKALHHHHHSSHIR